MHLFARITRFLLALVLVVTGLTACSSNGSDTSYYDSFCVDYLTGVRFPDYYCLVGNPYYHPYYRPYYVHPGYAVPAIGVHVSHYSRTSTSFKRPSSGVIHTGAPTNGGKAPKITSGPGIVRITAPTAHYNTGVPKQTVKRFQPVPPKPYSPRKR